MPSIWTIPVGQSKPGVFVDCVRQYCYLRERKYCPFDDLNDFGYVIKVKENAPDLLRKALPRLPMDVIAAGDYQAAEKKFGVSRRILEVCLELGFPVSVLERSPLVLRDLDLLKEINQRAPSVVFFSMISAPDLPIYDLVRQMENLAPRMEKRYAAMEQIARAGSAATTGAGSRITVGIARKGARRLIAHLLMGQDRPWVDTWSAPEASPLPYGTT